MRYSIGNVFQYTFFSSIMIFFASNGKWRSDDIIAALVTGLVVGLIAGLFPDRS